MIDPKEVTIETSKGPRPYILSKWPAIQGREIVTKTTFSNIPKLGDYATSETTMLLSLSFVAVPMPSGEPLRLTTRALIDNHVPDWETLAKLEVGMVEYNVSFFGNGKSFDFLANIGQTLRQWIVETLTDLSVASSKAAKQPSTNSAPLTH
jgi:hypothetical protein